MSGPYAFICTRTTADFIVPVSASSQAEFNRKVHNAFKGLVGGVMQVGDLKLRPTQAAVANHLLCDGSTITRAQFPQLVELLNPGESTATLPDYSGALTVAAPTVTQTTTDAATVSTTGTTVTTPPADTAGGTTGGNVPSGGRLPPRLYDELRDNPAGTHEP